MTINSKFLILVIVLLSACVVLMWLQINELKQSVADPEPGLVEQMAYMQRWTDKLAISVENENLELANFYLHELEETSETIIEHIEEYKGQPISTLTNTYLTDALEALEDAVKSGNVQELKPRLDRLITSCNSCHLATGFGFIKITGYETTIPFNQDFSK